MDKEALAGVLGITDDSIVKCDLWAFGSTEPID